MKMANINQTDEAPLDIDIASTTMESLLNVESIANDSVSIDNEATAVSPSVLDIILNNNSSAAQVASSLEDQLKDPVIRMTEKEATEWLRSLNQNIGGKIDPRIYNTLYPTMDEYFYVLLVLCMILMVAVVLLLYAFCCMYVMKGNLDLPGPHGLPQTPVKIWFKNPFKKFQREISREAPPPANDDQNFQAAQRRHEANSGQQAASGSGHIATSRGGPSGSGISFNTAFTDTLRKQLSREAPGSESPQYISLSEEF